MKLPVHEMISRANEGLEMVSTGLLLLQQAEGLEDLVGPKVVDITARLDSQYQSLERVLAPLRDRVKSEGLSHLDGADEATVRGNLYQAQVKRTLSEELDIPKVREYLGNLLRKFSHKKEDAEVTFQVKS